MSGGMAYASKREKEDESKRKVILRRKIVDMIDDKKFELAEVILNTLFKEIG